jgi:hypothetical protein
MKSWKTTLGGVLLLFTGAMTTYQETWQVAIKDERVQTAVIVGIALMFAKDSNVHGGTVGQPSSPEAIKVSDNK